MEKQGVKSKNEVSVGDVYVVRLPDKRFGAVRVADYNRFEGSYLLITTPYIGEEIPSIHDSSLKQILRQNRFFYKIVCQIKCTSSSSNASYAVFQPRHFLGRLLIS